MCGITSWHTIILGLVLSAVAAHQSFVCRYLTGVIINVCQLWGHNTGVYTPICLHLWGP